MYEIGILVKERKSFVVYLWDSGGTKDYNFKSPLTTFIQMKYDISLFVEETVICQNVEGTWFRWAKLAAKQWANKTTVLEMREIRIHRTFWWHSYTYPRQDVAAEVEASAWGTTRG